MRSGTKLKILQFFVALIITIAAAVIYPVGGAGYQIFIAAVMLFAVYLWTGILFFFVDLFWKLITKPQERLFATVMLGSTIFVAAMLLAAYWLIKGSLGVGGTILYAIGAYGVFSIVRWFRRHTASYYAALEREQSQAEIAGKSEPHTDEDTIA